MNKNGNLTRRLYCRFQKSSEVFSKPGLKWMTMGYAAAHLCLADVQGAVRTFDAPPTREGTYVPAPVGVDISIKGKVTDENGEALPGVSVMVKNSQKGIATDINGEYEISLSDGENILIFSFIGYQTKELTVSPNQSLLNVSLESDTKALDELVVVGYGTVKKSDLTGSVARVDAATFKNQSVTQITDVLAGSVAGFQANQGTSAAGGSSMEIRGVNSLNASTDPMIVLDGVIYNGSISDINPADIETLDILKDASSAAIFGARAASGVILITTTRGKTGKPTINFSTKLGVQKVISDDFAVRGPEEYLDFRRDYFRTLGLSQPAYYWHGPDNLPEGVTIDQWRSANPGANPDDTREWLSRLNFFPEEVESYLSGKTVDWSKEVLQTALRQEYDVSINGGSENVKYFWSAGWLDNDGIIRGDRFKTFRTRVNLDFKVTKWLNMGINAQYSNRDQSTTTASLSGMYSTSPFASIHNDDGSVRWFPHGYIGGQNPLLNYYGQDRNNKARNLFASIFAEVELPFNIKYRISYQPRLNDSWDYNYWSPETITGGDTYSQGRASRYDYSSSEWMLDNLLKWNKDFGVHKLDVTFLYNAEKFRDLSSTMTNNTFQPSPALGYHGMQFGNNPTISTKDERHSGDGMMGRINYSLMDKYLLTLSLRRDGFSAFGQENPRAYFPAAAFAWRISGENFFQSDLINDLKLRTSWGVNGNRSIGAFAAFSQMSSTQYYNGSATQIGVQTSTLSNKRLRWEETTSTNLGLDISLLSNRINASIDVYDAVTRNLLVNRSLPRVTGFQNVTTNIGSLANRGFELTIGSTNINNSTLTWKSNFNFSLNRNKIKSLFGETGSYVLEGQTHTGEIPDYNNQWFIGRPIDAVWEYNMLGVWQEEEAEEADRYNLKPGDIKAEDLDNNGAYEALQDKQFIGFSDPRYLLGLRNDVTFLKNFTASVFLRADLGHIRPFVEPMAGWSTYDRISTSNFQYWTPENRSNEYTRLSINDSPFGGKVMPYKPRSFFRVQDVSLAYNLPAAAVQSIGLQGVRVFGSARNLITISKWPGWDPESWDSDSRKSTPMPKTFTVGLNVTL